MGLEPPTRLLIGLALLPPGLAGRDNHAGGLKHLVQLVLHVHLGYLALSCFLLKIKRFFLHFLAALQGESIWIYVALRSYISTGPFGTLNLCHGLRLVLLCLLAKLAYQLAEVAGSGVRLLGLRR